MPSTSALIAQHPGWPNFSWSSLVCSHCSKRNPDPAFITFMDQIQVLRNNLGYPLVVTSAYRCPGHPLESVKAIAGQHSKVAIDLGVQGKQAHEVLKEAFRMGFNGIGVQQKGNGRFIHLDKRENPTVWSY